MARWKSPPELVAAFVAALPADARVERRPMFGCDAAFVHGYHFFGTFEDKIMVRLPESLYAQAMAIPGAAPFSPMPDRPMKGYVTLPGDLPARDMAEWAAKAFSWVATLPPKEKKAPKQKAPKAEAAPKAAKAPRATKPAS